MQHEIIKKLKKQAAKEEAKRRYARLNFKAFVLLKWDRFNQKPFLDSWHYDYLCKILEYTLPQSTQGNNENAPQGNTQGNKNTFNNLDSIESNKDTESKQIKRLILNMPPSYGKTEIIARSFIAWALGRDRSRKFIYISYSDELCNKINKEIRALLKSKFWLSIFKEPPRFLMENSSEILLEQGGGVLTTTLRSTLTGYHAHQILIDDPIKVADMSSKAERDRVNNTFREAVISRLQDTKSNITILMQRLGEEDLCGFILNPKNFENDIINQWKHIKLTALNKEKEIYKIGNFEYIREANEPLFTLKHDLQSLNDLKLQIGEDEFSTQYQQEPIASEAGYFLPAYFKEIPEYEIGKTREYIFVDSALSLNEAADNRAIVVISLENYQNSTRYIVKNCKFGIWNEIEIINNLISSMQSYPQAQVFIESDGGGLTLERLLNRELVLINDKLKKKDKALISNTINVYTPSRKVSKVEKIKAMRSYYNTGYLVFLHNTQGLEQIRKELLSFNPEKPFRKDDCIDCIASCIAHKDCLPPPNIESKSLYYDRYATPRTWRI